MRLHHLSMIILRGVKVSRISYGIPIGGELEYVDGNTIAQSYPREDCNLMSIKPDAWIKRMAESEGMIEPLF